jgi:beta-galactosidase
VIVAPDGKEVAKAEAAKGSRVDGGARYSQDIKLDGPELWSIDSPQLYELRTEVVVDGEVKDVVKTKFGIRSAEFRSDTGFWLNGVNLKLKGVCLHHDAGALGAAVPLSAWERRFKALKELGVNAIRTSHNPVDPGFLDLCDQMGFLVMNEVFDCWTKGKNKADYHLSFKEWSHADLRDTILRDRNHPSVVLYSVGNEIRDTHDAKLAKEILSGLVDVCHEYDPTRPVTQGLFRPNVTKDYDNGLADLLDVIGTNYRDRELLDAWVAKSGRKIIGTEQGHDKSTWVDCRDHPQHAGQFLWVGIDYLGESRNWPLTCFNAGLLDRTGWVQPRGWERKSWWSDEPMVKMFRRLGRTEATPSDPGYDDLEWRRLQMLFPDWNAKGEQNIEVYAVADEVELFLNGKSLGTKPAKRDTALNWQVPFEAGTLKAVAKIDGEIVASDELKTAGKAARLTLEAELTSVSQDFEDVAYVQVRVVDADGTVVPDASNLVKFSIEGPGRIEGVDSGDIMSTERMKANERKAFQGRCIVIVRGTDLGKITIRAEAEGLVSTQTEIEVR